MLRWPVLLALPLLVIGCTSKDVFEDAAPSCVPAELSATPENDVVLVQARFTNCGSSAVALATQVCNAPWTAVTVHVVEMPRGRLPIGWGVLTGEGHSRALLDRFSDPCPASFETLEPHEPFEMSATWNGTFHRDACADRQTGNAGGFSCPLWRPAPAGLYRFESWAWPVAGRPWEARADVEWPGRSG